MSEHTAPRTQSTRRGRHADASLRVKFALMVGVVVLAFAAVAAVTSRAVMEVRADADLVARLTTADSVVLQLDTRASELKVDGYKALVRPDPAAEKDELRDDTATATQLLQQLRAIPLTGKPAARATAVQEAYTGYFTAIDAFVDAAVADQEGTRAAWEDIQVANDATDAAVGDAKDVLGAASTRAQRALTDRVDRLLTTTLLLALAGVLLIVVMCAQTLRAIVRPLRRLAQALTAVGAGDLGVTVSVSSRDELGAMATALTGAQHELRAFVRSVSDSALAVEASATAVSTATERIADSATSTAEAAGTAAQASGQVRHNVETVSAGGEQMGAAIREISTSSTEAARVAAQAVAEAAETNAAISKLDDSSREIGDVVKVITSIAEQTNLLALNATIEAARAGEAGKGFAVVATEVKELAQETARATEDIARRVETIQADTAASITAIGRIGEIIGLISDHQTTIASAVEEQSATTAEMNRNVAEAAGGSSDVAGSIGGLASAASVTADGAAEVRLAASGLLVTSSGLREAVARYRL